MITAAEVGRRLGMSKSTTYRYLQSLRSSGLLEDDAERGGFRLGPLILRLGYIARRGTDLSAVALPVMRDLSAELNETVLLTRRHGAQVVCLERVESSAPLRISYQPGHLLPVHAGASATVLLAWADPQEVTEALGAGRLPRYTSSTVTSPRRLRKRLEEIRERGYAVSEGEVDEGVVGVAAPVFGASGSVVAGLSAVGPAQRITPSVLGSVVASVRSSAARITSLLEDLG